MPSNLFGSKRLNQLLHFRFPFSCEGASQIFIVVTGSHTSPATTTLHACIILLRRQLFWLGYDVHIKMYNCMVHGYPQSPVQSHQPSPSRSIKRKFHNDEDASTSPFCSEKVDSLCSQPISTPRTQQTLAGSNEFAEFYPIPKDLDQAVLASMGVGGSRQRDIPMHVWGKRPQHSVPCLLEPPTNMEPMMNSDDMDENMDKAANGVHGPHCRSIPRLSVRDTGHESSELWAFCPDCHAFGKVQDT